jgi:hypothetical protein
LKAKLDAQTTELSQERQAKELAEETNEGESLCSVKLSAQVFCF